MFTAIDIYRIYFLCTKWLTNTDDKIDGLVQDCSNSICNVLERYAIEIMSGSNVENFSVNCVDDKPSLTASKSIEARMSP